MTTLDLIADDREQVLHGSYLSELRAGCASLSVSRLKFGDYAFYGAPTQQGKRPFIGIEVSSVSDVIGKMNGDRFSMQITGMVETYDIPYLLIESPIVTNTSGRIIIRNNVPAIMQYNRFWSMLNAAQAHGVIVTYAQNKADVPATILRLGSYWMKAHNEHKLFRPRESIREFSTPSGTILDGRVSTLMTIPGVGESRAVDALKDLKSIQLMTVVGEKRLSDIPGWGPTTARSFWRHITRGE